ncbi:hypothetical protein EV356DRAFT_496400 [Viridothelium virens]|uniref:Protein kinase domain-containing protein n=1 Tax=Viridothelium virens TaxID=1048519 RepID=A0A6A6GTR5_VIRVR|nr:hypothetical protein EV356DRAFT_496400 [Viridothelium virens]
MPCFGVYDDLDFEIAHRLKRVGYVFGMFSGNFEDDLRQFPPKSLRELIRETCNNPPLLGDRFELANKLISAFSLFHAAGWLHKGFRSENIFFLHKADGTGVSISQPFIKGFQYSRFQIGESVKFDEEKSPDSEYYYHRTCYRQRRKEIS